MHRRRKRDPRLFGGTRSPSLPASQSLTGTMVGPHHDIMGAVAHRRLIPAGPTERTFYCTPNGRGPLARRLDAVDGTSRCGPSTTSRITCSTPRSVMPSLVAAECDRSMIRDSTYGPRSFTRTTTLLLLSRQRTRTLVP